MKSREDFKTEEEYQQYLIEYSAIKFQSSLIESNPDSASDALNSNPKIYEKFSRWAIRHAKTLIQNLRNIKQNNK